MRPRPWRCPTRRLIVRSSVVATQLPSGKKKGIGQRRVKGMRVRDLENALIVRVLPVHNDVLGPSEPLPITNHNNCNLIDSGIRKVVVTPITILVKVKRDATMAIRIQGSSELQGLLIEMNSRMGSVKNTLK